MNTFHKTFAILSKELNVPILPVCIQGAFKALPRGRMLPTPHHISVEYLPLIKPNAANSYEELAALVQSTINAKL
jgi:long-chain acyl-CoA synthetase